MINIIRNNKVPYWLDVLWEDASNRTHQILSEYSEDYRKLKDRKADIIKEYPELINLIEGDEIGHDVILDEGRRKQLVELIGICMDILWLYEKNFYLLGMTVGMKLSEILHQIDSM